MSHVGARIHGPYHSPRHFDQTTHIHVHTVILKMIAVVDVASQVVMHHIGSHSLKA